MTVHTILIKNLIERYPLQTLVYVASVKCMEMYCCYIIKLENIYNTMFPLVLVYICSHDKSTNTQNTYIGKFPVSFLLFFLRLEQLLKTIHWNWHWSHSFIHLFPELLSISVKSAGLNCYWVLALCNPHPEYDAQPSKKTPTFATNIEQQTDGVGEPFQAFNNHNWNWHWPNEFAKKMRILCV